MPSTLVRSQTSGGACPAPNGTVPNVVGLVTDHAVVQATLSAGAVYANPTSQGGVSSGNSHVVAQYDVACFQQTQH